MRRCKGLLVLALCSALAGTASAQSRAQWWLGLGGGLNTYGMSDVNADIARVNAAINAPTGLFMDSIQFGWSVGLQAGVDLGSHLGVFAIYERLLASAEVRDASAGLRYYLPANVLAAGARYKLPGRGPTRVGLAFAAGMVRAAGQLRLVITNVGVGVGDVTGSGLFLQGQAFIDFRAGQSLTFTPSIGYRLATIGEITVDEQPVRNPDGSAFKLQYSGLAVRLTFRLLHRGRATRRGGA